MDVDVPGPRGFCEYLSENAKFRHGVDNTQECGNSLCLLANLGLVDLEIDLVVFEVLLDLLAIYIIDIQIRDGQDTLPMLVAVGQLRVLRIEDTVEEGEVVGYLFIAIHVEAILGLRDGRCKVGHVEYEGEYPNVEKDTRVLKAVVLKLGCMYRRGSIRRYKKLGRARTKGHEHRRLVKNDARASPLSKPIATCTRYLDPPGSRPRPRKTSKWGSFASSSPSTSFNLLGPEGWPSTAAEAWAE